MKLVLAITGASGSLYAKRFLDLLVNDPQGPHEIHIALSSHAREVAAAEIGQYEFPSGVHVHDDRSMQVPFVSGSAAFDAMVIMPCSMGTVGRIAHGYSDSVITRAADVFLKEKRKLILVPRETPWNLIQARNIVTVMEAGRGGDSRPSHRSTTGRRRCSISSTPCSPACSITSASSIPARSGGWRRSGESRCFISLHSYWHSFRCTAETAQISSFARRPTVTIVDP